MVVRLHPSAPNFMTTNVDELYRLLDNNDIASVIRLGVLNEELVLWLLCYIVDRNETRTKGNLNGIS